YDNKTVQIRWRFTTDGGAEFDGFFLDTIAVTNAKGPGPCTPVGGCDNPTATVSGGGAICAGGSTNIQAALTGTPPWSVTWSDMVVQSNILVSPATRSVSPASSVTYTVTAVSSALCAGTPSGSAPVTVNPIPATPSITGAAGVCTNAALSLTATAGYTSYQWYLGGNPIGGATSQTYGVASAQAGNSGSYTVTGTLAGCTSLASAPLVVTVAPCAAPTVQSISKPCASTTGGLPLTITGTGFQQGATVTLINTPAVVNSVTPTQIGITTASRVPTTPALGDVKVTNPDTQTGTLTDGFTYALRGDANGNGSLTGADAFFLNLHIFLGGAAPPTLCSGDANGSGATTGADGFFLNLYIFLGGAAPPA
ncbi:MAG: IPT/TIG domain-containing protein, partial [Acidobacteria bacterium]|nr:IPT/TIG domain-containing protein [Acidobacteriota bacterium]